MPSLIIESLASHLESRGFVILETAMEHVVVGGGFMLYRYGFGLHAHMFGIGKEYDRRWSQGKLVVITHRPDGVILGPPYVVDTDPALDPLGPVMLGTMIDLNDPTALDQIDIILCSSRRPWRWVQRLIHGFQRWSRSLGGL